MIVLKLLNVFEASDDFSCGIIQNLNIWAERGLRISLHHDTTSMKKYNFDQISKISFTVPANKFQIQL